MDATKPSSTINSHCQPSRTIIQFLGFSFSTFVSDLAGATLKLGLGTHSSFFFFGVMLPSLWALRKSTMGKWTKVDQTITVLEWGLTHGLARAQLSWWEVVEWRLGDLRRIVSVFRTWQLHREALDQSLDSDLRGKRNRVNHWIKVTEPNWISIHLPVKNVPDIFFYSLRSSGSSRCQSTNKLLSSCYSWLQRFQATYRIFDIWKGCP